jgi:hypothetical protein
LIKSIRSLLPNTPHGAQADSERRLLAECIFYIAYQTTARAADVKSLLTLVSRSLAAHRRRRRSRRRACALHRSCRVACQLDRSNALADPFAASVVRADGNARLLLDAAFVRDVQALLEPRWQHAGAQAALTLAWAVFVAPRGNRADGGPLRDDGSRAPPPVGDADIETLFARAVRGGACLYLAQVTSSSAYRTSVDTRHLLAGVFDELVTGLLTHLSLTNFALCPLPTATSFDASASAATACVRRRASQRQREQQSACLQELAQRYRAALVTTRWRRRAARRRRRRQLSATDAARRVALSRRAGAGAQVLDLRQHAATASTRTISCDTPSTASASRFSARASTCWPRWPAARRGRGGVAHAVPRQQVHQLAALFRALHGFLTDLTRTDSGLVIDPFAGVANSNGGGAARSASERRRATDARH